MTVLFTDIAGSTERAAELGDTQWRRLLDAHNRSMRRQLKRHQGREIDTAGDGFFATFQQPAHAIDCALDMIEALVPIGVHIRAGVHMGEVDVLGPKVSGMTVHLGARLMSLASADQVIVSSTVRDLMSGSELPFTDQGVRRLKGVDAEWHVYSIDGPAEQTAELDLPEPDEPPSWWRRPMALGVGAMVLLLGLTVGILLTRDGGALTPTANRVILIDDGGALANVVPVGTGLRTMAADGQSLWVANTLDRTVQRVDLERGTAEPAEGGLLNAPTSITTGNGLVWVGTSLATEGSLSRMDPSQPNSAQTVDLGAPVSGLAFGFSALWATDADGAQLLRLDLATDAVEHFELPADSGPTGLAVSSDAVWVALHGAGEIARFDPETGDVTATIPSAAGAPDQVAVGAGFVWVTVGDGDAVIRIDPRTNSPFTIGDVGDGPAGIVASDQGVWVANSLGSSVVRIDPEGGANLTEVRVGRNVSPQAVVATPAGVWASLISR